MHQPNKLSAVLLSSVIIIIISVVPLLNFINLGCCAGVIFGGAAGTFFYNKQLKSAGEIIHYKDGAAIGILSGIVSALIVVIFTTLLSMIVNQNPIPEMYKIFDQYGYNLPPDASRFLEKISDEYAKKGFSITLTLISLAVDLVTYPLFSALGGLLAAGILSKRENGR